MRHRSTRNKSVLLCERRIHRSPAGSVLTEPHGNTEMKAFALELSAEPYDNANAARYPICEN